MKYTAAIVIGVDAFMHTLYTSTKNSFSNGASATGVVPLGNFQKFSLGNPTSTKSFILIASEKSNLKIWRGSTIYTAPLFEKLLDFVL